MLASLDALVGYIEACTDHVLMGSLENLTVRLERATGTGAPPPPVAADASATSMAALTAQLEGLVTRMEAAAC